MSESDDKALRLVHSRPMELDEHGRVLSPQEIRARGLLEVGRKLVEERQLDAMAGAPHRPLDAFEAEALEAATGGDQARDGQHDGVEQG